MKKAAALFLTLACLTALTACRSMGGANINSAGTVIEMQMDKNYDDADPFVNERLFCVSEDMAALTVKVNAEVSGEKGVLMIKNNKTNEVLWSGAAWEGPGRAESFSISLEGLKRGEEYAVCFTGTKIDYAAIELAFESSLVQERERPL
ncbi:MAG: DUF4624 family lipoprotein [Ruthenibacterium sp.]